MTTRRFIAALDVSLVGGIGLLAIPDFLASVPGLVCCYLGLLIPLVVIEQTGSGVADRIIAATERLMWGVGIGVVLLVSVICLLLLARLYIPPLPDLLSSSLDLRVFAWLCMTVGLLTAAWLERPPRVTV